MTRTASETNPLPSEETDYYYSRSNPRYGVTESFPPPRSFSAQNPPRGNAALPSSLRRRTYVAEAVSEQRRSSGLGGLGATSMRALRRVGAFLRSIATPKRVAMLILIGSLALLIGTATGALPRLDALSLPTLRSSEQPSTPQSQWRAGTMPFLYQNDTQWANLPYAGGTIAENGCGPTCLSMVYVQLTGRIDKGPAEMAAFSEQRGYVEGGATSWSLMTEGALELGLESREVPADANQVADLLAAGTPIVCSVRPGDFTTTGHFIVLAGLNDAGQAIVHDPNSVERSSRPWDVQHVLDQCKNLWAFA